MLLVLQRDSEWEHEGYYVKAWEQAQAPREQRERPQRQQHEHDIHTFLLTIYEEMPGATVPPPLSQPLNYPVRVTPALSEADAPTEPAIAAAVQGQCG